VFDHGHRVFHRSAFWEKSVHLNCPYKKKISGFGLLPLALTQIKLKKKLTDAMRRLNLTHIILKTLSLKNE